MTIELIIPFTSLYYTYHTSLRQQCQRMESFGNHTSRHKLIEMSPMSQLISEGENGDGDEYEEETTVDAKTYIVFRAQHNVTI